MVSIRDFVVGSLSVKKSILHKYTKEQHIVHK